MIHESEESRGSEQVPQVQTAQSMAQEAKRRLRAAQGLRILMVGLFMVVLAAMQFFAGKGSTLAMGLVALAAGLALFILPGLVHRARARGGVSAVEKGGLASGNWSRDGLSRKTSFAVGAGFATVLGATLALAFSSAGGPGGNAAAGVTRVGISAALCAFGLAFIWSFSRMKMWEEIALGAGCMAAGCAWALGYSWGWPLVVLGASALVAGLSYQWRWVRFVRAAQKA